ncbi:ABC transporter permease [Chlamydiota bacterium]
MFSYIKELIQYRELFYNFALRDIKIRYKQTFFGAAWAVFQPFVLMVVFTIIFSRFMRISSEGIPYPVFSYCALVPWVFFSNSISMATNSLIGNLNLVTKVYFPREILPFASIVAFLFDFLIAFIIVIGLLLFYKIKLSFYILFFPLMLLIQIILVFGVSLLSSSLNVKYRDIKYVVPLGMQIWMYLTPIIYPVTVVPEKIRWLYMINPMAGIINSYRNILLKGTAPEFSYLLYSAIVSVVLFILAYRYFKKSEKFFADII